MSIETSKIDTLDALSGIYGGGVIRTDRGNGSAGPVFIDEETCRDEDGDGAPVLSCVSRDEDPDAWRLAEEAHKDLGFDAPTIVAVAEPRRQNGTISPSDYQAIYSV